MRDVEDYGRAGMGPTPQNPPLQSPSITVPRLTTKQDAKKHVNTSHSSEVLVGFLFKRDL
jgi:hypothetical protein